MVDIKWKVNKCCHQNHFCIPVNIISLPDALNFYISPDTKVLSHFVPLLVSCRPEHLVNSCVLCSPVAQMVQLVSNSSLSLVLINHRDISVISKRGYLTVNRRTGIMIDPGVAVFVQTVWFALLSLRVALERLSNQQNHVGSDNNKTEYDLPISSCFSWRRGLATSN